MAVSYMLPTGGLSPADKQVVCDNMLETASIMNGKLRGTLPVQKTYVFEIPMFSKTPVSIPLGYYGENIVVKPKYVSGTEFTDFSSTGYFGQGHVFVNRGNSGTVRSEGSSVGSSGVWLKASNRAESDGQASYRGFMGVWFDVPFAHDYDYAVVSCSGADAAVTFSSSPLTSGEWNRTGSGDVRIPYSKNTPYLNVGLAVNGAWAWGQFATEMRLTKITFYKNVT